MSMQTLREFMSRHVASATGLAVLGAALDARASGTPLEPALAARVQEVLAALGAGDVLDGISAEEARPVLGEVRLSLQLDAKLLYARSRAPGWNHGEPEILQAVGDFARSHAHGLTRGIIPALDGLAARLAAPGGAFLDIGVGVAGTALEMARLWPALRIVGIDPWQPSLALARSNVAAAGLAERIELREQGAEHLPDQAAFDLVWMPVVFMPERIVAAACERVLAALKPGGWVVVTPFNLVGADALRTALGKLRMTMFGGPPYSPDQVETLLSGQGFADVRTLPAPPGSPLAPVVGRRKA